MKFLIDTNLSTKWTDLLQRAGYEAIHAIEASLQAAGDELIMERACKTGEVIITNDLDFGAILMESGARAPSVIQIRAGNLRPSSTIGVRVLEAIAGASRELDSGALVTVSEKRTRVRTLPMWMSQQDNFVLIMFLTSSSPLA